MSKDQLKSLLSDSPGTTPRVKRKRSLSFLLPLGLLAGFVVIFAFLFGSRLLPATEVQTVPVVTLRAAQDSRESTSPVPRSELPSSASLLFQASGWVEPDPYITMVPTLQNGIVDEVHVLEGATVKKGEVLATLVADDARLDLQQAKQKLETIRSNIAAHCSAGPALSANLAAGKKRVAAEEARLAELADTATRLSSLPSGAVPPREVTQARLQVERQAALLDEAKAEIPRLETAIVTLDFERIAMGNAALEADTALQRAQLAMDRTTIKAPMDGIVLHLHAAPGKKRMLDMDDPKSAAIVELYDPEKLQARIDVPLNEAAQLSVGQPVTLVTDLLPDTEFEGSVTRIVGEADLQRNTLQAKVALHKPDQRLRPGMLMRAKFFSGSTRSPGALTTREGQSSGSARLSLFAAESVLFNLTDTSAQAWVANDGRAEQRDLTLGPEHRDDHRQVLTGLRSGEHLIVPPHHKLKEGVRIKTIPSTGK